MLVVEQIVEAALAKQRRRRGRGEIEILEFAQRHRVYGISLDVIAHELEFPDQILDPFRIRDAVDHSRTTPLMGELFERGALLLEFPDRPVASRDVALEPSDDLGSFDLQPKSIRHVGSVA